MLIDLRNFDGAYYDFLTWIARHFPPGSRVLELGTHDGSGARAFAKPGHFVDTYDVSDAHVPSNLETEKLKFHKSSALDLPASALTHNLIYLDITHNGTDETAFLKTLDASPFAGLLICDDIDICPEMETFWAERPAPKHTMRVLDHRTRIGLISYNPAILLIS